MVCTRCRRWNLTPLEERWEAFEECERIYRDTRLRLSTDQIGLARVREGTELIRIGEPLRPEFASWRYGRMFGARRRNTLIYSGLAAAGVVAVLLGAKVAGISWLTGSWITLYSMARNARVLARVRGPEGKVLRVRATNADSVSVSRSDSLGDWQLSLKYRKKMVRYSGADAVAAMRVLLPAVNRSAGKPEDVLRATTALVTEGGPEKFLAGFDKHIHRRPRLELDGMLAHRRLALEMALHEDQERRAMEGELQELESAWREAEEIAAIADNMFTPPSSEDFIERHRSRESRLIGKGEVDG